MAIKLRYLPKENDYCCGYFKHKWVVIVTDGDEELNKLRYVKPTKKQLRKWHSDGIKHIKLGTYN